MTYETRDMGRSIYCKSHPKGGFSYPHWVSRVLCMVEHMVDCKTCPHRNFIVTFQAHIGDQQVACPRWPSDADRIQKGEPPQYALVRRESCLRIRPYGWCPSCANSCADKSPRTQPGWWEQEMMGKKYDGPGRFEEIDDELAQPGGFERDGVTGYSAPVTIRTRPGKKRPLARKTDSSGRKRRASSK